MMKEWALQCAATGLRVHPLYEVDDDLVCRCWAREKCGEKARGKHPRLSAWQTMASADAGLVAQWWAQWPDAGIGIATGKASRLWVLDLDGEEALNWYRGKCREHGVTKTVGVATGRGRHLWWTWPSGDVTIRNSSKRIGPDVDVRGDGGYVIAPPTMHRSGVRYAMLTEGMYADAPVEAPAWLLELVKEQPKPAPVRVELPRVVTPLELRRVFRDAVDTDPDVRQRLGEQAGGRFRPASRPYVDGIRCPSCGRAEVWFYIDGGPAVCHHRNSCKWAGPLTRLLGATV